MNRINKLFTLILICILTFKAKAQNNDFINGSVIIGKDTLAGKIRLDSDDKLSKSVYFSSAKNNSVFTPKDIDAFIFNDNNIIYKRVPYKKPGKDTTTEYRFAKQIISGKATLYELELPPKEQVKIYLNGIIYVYFLFKDNQFYQLQQTEQIENNVYKLRKPYIGLLKALLIDCNKLENYDFERLEFSQYELAKVVDKYNTCDGKTLSTIKAKEKTLKRQGFEIFTASAITQKVDNGEKGKRFGFGYFCDFFQRKEGAQNSFSTGLSYFHNTYYQFYEEMNGIKIDDYKKLNRHNLMIPIHGHYYFKSYKSKFVPYVIYGLYGGFVVDNKFDDLHSFIGLDCGAGFYFNKFRVNINYNNPTVKNNQATLLNLNVGYTLKSNAK